MELKIALAGNPNSGKTTLFNTLTGSSQHVGNWPGVTVEKKEGRLKGETNVIVQDLPGIYSLSPYTLEEVITRTYLMDEKPDVILNIVDGTNIERNLYLTTQLVELGIPMVVAINMMDLVEKQGDAIDCAALSQSLGCEVVALSALRGNGAREAALAAIEAARGGRKTTAPCVFGGSVEHALAHIEESVAPYALKASLRWYAIKVFERDEKILGELRFDTQLWAHIEAHVADCERELDDDAVSVMVGQRYEFVHKLVSTSVKRRRALGVPTVSDRIDKVVTNRVLALPIFAAVMFLVYYISITTIGTMGTDFVNDTLFGEWILPAAHAFMEETGVAVWLAGLVTDGIVGGVGAVLGFVPQMLVLFLLLSLLEDCGYMTRVAFIMDRIFRKFGLSGKSFIPMLIGSGCSVPGIMASRTIERDADRKLTIITTSFIPCGAKMPIVALIAGALFGGAWWVAPAAYFIGVASVLVSGVILKKFRAFAGDPAPFVMELPPYHCPSAPHVLRSAGERAWSFIVRAGTVILTASVAIWFLTAFGVTEDGWTMVEDMDHSALAAIGGWLAPLFAPLGFGTWQSTVATVMGLVAKEEVVGVFGVLYGVSGDALELVENGEFGGLSAIAAHFTQLSAFSFLLFNLLCAPCFAAMGAIKREMGGARWTGFAIAYLCGFAYAVALIVYQLGLWLSGEVFTYWTAAALALLGAFLYLLFRESGSKARVKAYHAAVSKA